MARRRRLAPSQPGTAIVEIGEGIKHEVARPFPGYAAECHPDRPEAREGKCRECLQLERLERSGQRQLAKTIAEQNAIAQVMAEDERYVEELLIEAKRIIQERLPDYARLHFEAATEAATRGDSKPAEWALERVNAEKADKSKPIAPTKKDDVQSSGVQIIIGVQLGGSQLPTSESTIVVDAEKIEGA